MGRNKCSIRKSWLEKISEKNILIALNVLYAKKENIYPTYVSKQNSNREKQVILLMILNEKAWHYLAVKNLSALIRGIMSKHHGAFYCLNLPSFFCNKKELELHKNYVKIKIFVMSLCLLKTLKY